MIERNRPGIDPIRLGPRFVNIDHDPPLLRPPHRRAWVLADPLVHFILEAVAALDRRPVRVHTRGTGSEPYPPHLWTRTWRRSRASTASRRKWTRGSAGTPSRKSGGKSSGVWRPTGGGGRLCESAQPRAPLVETIPAHPVC